MSKQTNERRRTLDSHLSLKMQEQKFICILKARLFTMGYTVAVPEPDHGEDIWIGESVNKSKNLNPRTIYRAQVKSVYSYEECTSIDKRRYEVNDCVGDVVTVEKIGHRDGFYGE